MQSTSSAEFKKAFGYFNSGSFFSLEQEAVTGQLYQIDPPTAVEPITAEPAIGPELPYDWEGTAALDQPVRVYRSVRLVQPFTGYAAVAGQQLLDQNPTTFVLPRMLRLRRLITAVEPGQLLASDGDWIYQGDSRARLVTPVPQGVVSNEGAQLLLGWTPEDVTKPLRSGSARIVNSNAGAPGFAGSSMLEVEIEVLPARSSAFLCNLLPNQPLTLATPSGVPVSLPAVLDERYQAVMVFGDLPAECQHGLLASYLQHSGTPAEGLRAELEATKARIARLERYVSILSLTYKLSPEPPLTTVARQELQALAEAVVRGEHA